MSRLISGNGQLDKINGIAHEFTGLTVTTGDAKVVDRVNKLELNNDTQTFVNASNYFNLASTAGALGTAGLTRQPAAGQYMFAWNSAVHSGANGNIYFGDGTSSRVQVGRNGMRMYSTPTGYIDGDNFATAFGSLTASLFGIFNAEDKTIVQYLYDTNGDEIEDSISGTTESGTFASGQLVLGNGFAMSENTSFQIGSCGLAFFDKIPSDLLTGLGWMAANPTLGIYPSWREI